MHCTPETLRRIPLFRLLDDEEAAVLASEVSFRQFAPRQIIFRLGEPGGRAYIISAGRVQLLTRDEDQREVVVDEPGGGDCFGLASLLDGEPHQTTARALEPTEAIEIDRHDLEHLLQRKPLAGMDMLTMLGRQFHGAQRLVRQRAARNPNEVIAERTTLGERLADAVARFGGSWTFIIVFAVLMLVYTAINVLLGRRAWDPYPFILLNLFLSTLAAIQAPIIMMSQNRQDAKDRLRGELDYNVNQRAEQEIQGLAGKLDQLGSRLDDVFQCVRRQAGGSESPS